MKPEQLEIIEQEAVLAIGGPEHRCQIAMANIYKKAGILPQDLEIPSGDRDWASSQGRSLIAEWVEESGYFDEVAEAQPGDLLGFRLGHTLHHVAIQLSGGRIAHIIMPHGLRIAPTIPEAWQKRIAKIWRPKA